MKGKKHIDELFKERFKEFEATPSPHVWSNIQTQLKKEKDDRKIIPLWIRVAGVAAILALLLTIGNFVFNPFEDSNNTIVVDDTDTINKQEDPSIDLDKGPNNNDPVIASEDATNPSNTNSDEKDTEGDNKSKTSIVKDNIVKSKSSSLEAIAIEKSKDNNQTNKSPLIKDSDRVITTNTKEATAVITDTETSSEKIISEKTKNTTTSETIKNTEDLIKKDIDIQDAKTPVVVATENGNDTTETDGVEKSTDDDVVETEKRSLIDVINEKNAEEEDAIAKTSNDPENRWDVTPNFAPVYYDSFGSGSSIDPSFADNSQSGDVNFSYGVQVSYNISDRLSIRSGINNVKLGYTTGDVELAEGPVSAALRSVDYGGRQVVLTAFDKGTIAAATPGNLEEVTPKSTGGNPEINQNISYFEVPVELKYALLDSKFGINMIGGFSTLFLGSNEISVTDGDFSSTLGEANNLSSVSFSTNIGLGFDYNISKKLKFNIEPILKYQLNPYTDSSVDFKPYYFGIYSGLSFKF